MKRKVEPDSTEMVTVAAPALRRRQAQIDGQPLPKPVALRQPLPQTVADGRPQGGAAAPEPKPVMVGAMQANDPDGASQKPAPVAAATPAHSPAPVIAGPGPVPAQVVPVTPSPAAAPVSPPKAVRPPVRPARLKSRHAGVLASLLLFVLLPAAAVAYYLWEIAADQYASTVGFSVRREEVGSALDILGGITALSGSSSSDTDILYEFIQSQKLVAEIDTALDLRVIWSRPENDPVFAYAAPGTIEDLAAHWRRKVQVSYDAGSQLIEVRALAFTPEDATAIATTIYEKSSEMINALSAIAREDSIRFARQDLDEAVARLKTARLALTAFRNKNQIVDPATDIQSQASLLGLLQARLAEALIELDLLNDATKATDPRVIQAQRRIAVIENRIHEERRKLGIGSEAAGDEVLADVLGEYESLVVDREFAERTYTASLATYDGALAEARRQTRYLAAHVLPTSAESAQFPQRLTLLALASLFLFLIWSICLLVYYSLKDRR